MCHRITKIGAFAVALAALPLLSFNATAQIAVSANDNKAVLVNGVKLGAAESGRRYRHHRQSGRLAAQGDRRAPGAEQRGGAAQNVAVTPDESIALVSSNQKLDPADATKLVPDNRLSVIDLKANPPAVIATIEPGLAPAGIGINRAGTMALVANRGDGTVAVLTISGKTVTVAGKVDFGNPKSGPSSAAFSPDGKMALVTRDGDYRYFDPFRSTAPTSPTPRNILVGAIRPYAIQFTPKGDAAIVGFQGGGHRRHRQRQRDRRQRQSPAYRPHARRRPDRRRLGDFQTTANTSR